MNQREYNNCKIGSWRRPFNVLGALCAVTEVSGFRVAILEHYLPYVRTEGNRARPSSIYPLAGDIRPRSVCTHALYRGTRCKSVCT